MLSEIAVHEFSTLQWSFQQDVLRYASRGIDKIGVSRAKASDFGFEAAADLLFEMKMDVSSVHWAGGFTGCDGQSYIEAIEDAKSAIEFASHINAECLMVHSGGRNGHTIRHAIRIFEHAIDTLLPVAEDYGVRLAVEPMGGADSQAWSIYRNIKPYLNMVQAYDSDSLGVAVDLFHCGLDLNALKLFTDVSEKICLLQIADRTTSQCRHRRLPGQGNVDIAKWLETLGAAGVQCPVEIEAWGEINRAFSYDQRLDSVKHFAQGHRFAVAQIASSTTRSSVSESSRTYKN